MGLWPGCPRALYQLQEWPSDWQVSRLLPRNLGIFNADSKQRCDLGWAAKIFRTRREIRAEAQVHPHVFASVRVDRVTWRLMKHWHFSDALNPNTPTIHRPGD